MTEQPDAVITHLGDANCDQIHKLGTSSIQRNVVAVYDTATTTIYLPPDWTGSSAGDQSVLVHELVHYLQKIAQLKYECPAARHSRSEPSVTTLVEEHISREKVAYLAQDDSVMVHLTSRRRKRRC